MVMYSGTQSFGKPCCYDGSGRSAGHDSHKVAFYCYIGHVVLAGFTIPDEEQN